MPDLTEEAEKTDKKVPKPRVRQVKKLGRVVEDALLAEKSRVWQKVFLQEVAAFTAIDPGLDATYAANWMSAILAFEAFGTDELMVDYIGEKTAELLEARKKVLQTMNELEFYVKKAFPDDERMPFEFGIANVVYESNHATFVVNGFVTGTVVNDYQAQLLAAGMPPDFEARLQTQLENMAAAEIEQERQKLLRIRATTQRAKLYNELHQYWKRVSNAAAVRFYGQDAPQIRFWQMK